MRFLAGLLLLIWNRSWVATIAACLQRTFTLRRYLVTALVLIGATLAVPSFAIADIILDEFTDSSVARIVRGSGGFVETLNIGDVNARREIRLVGGGTEVVGGFDISVTSPGQMDVRVEEIIRRISGLPISAVQFNYYFDPADVTEGGKNDAILFDFAELTGDIQPSFFRAIVFDDTHLQRSFLIEFSPLVPNGSPHTLVAPFDEFTLRSGAPGLPDPTTLKTIFFDFYFLGHEGELNWSARLERIRFGSMIPEPASVVLLLFGIVVTWNSRWLWTVIGCFRRSFMLRRSLITALVLIGGVLSAASSSRADIILDEFTDSTIAPIVGATGGFAETENVGDLSARREIRLVGAATDVLGSFDIDVTSSEQMAVHIEEIIPKDDLPISAVQFNYVFQAADVTEGGRNDAILFDFVELTGDIQPTYLRAWVLDDRPFGRSYIKELFPLKANSSPHTLAARFDDFTLRNGAPGVPDPTILREIRFDFFFLGHRGELNWSARLERIRFGSSVPEPGSVVLLLIGIVVLWNRSWFVSQGVGR
jgi:hypothetical protein